MAAKNQQEIADILPNGGCNSVSFLLRSFLGESKEIESEDSSLSG